MNARHALRRCLVPLIAVALTACGGGGDGDTGTAASPAATRPATGAGSAGISPVPGTQASAGTTSAAVTVRSGPLAGDLIGAEAAGASWAAALAGLERMRYHTVNVRGQLAPASAMLLIPRGSAPPGGWPVVVWAHGTAGVADQCAPSQRPEELERMLAITGMGYVVVAPDYEGLGVDGPHPYLDLASAARSVVYAVRAVRQRVPSAGVRWAVMGHSQGGHASLGAAELAATLAPELQLVGAVAFAPAAQFKTIADWYQARVDDWDSAPATFARALPIAVNENGLVGLVAAGIKAVEPDFDYTRMLGADLLGLMPRIEDSCPDTFGKEITEDLLQTVRPGRGISRFQTYAPDWASDPAVARFLTVNEPGRRKAVAPVLVLQGDDDMVVPRLAGDLLNSALCSAGSRVDYRVFAAQDHISIVGYTMAQAQEWLRQRFAGSPAGTTCGAEVAVLD